jgi:hypothetical protein
MTESDIKRLASLKRDKSHNEQALANAIFESHAHNLQRAIRSQDREIARLEAQQA